MPHQQKLVHIQDITGVPPGGGFTGIVPGLMYNAQNEPSLALARHKTSVEAYGADPGGDFRWYTILAGTNFLLVYVSTNGGTTSMW